MIQWRFAPDPRPGPWQGVWAYLPYKDGEVVSLNAQEAKR